MLGQSVRLVTEADHEFTVWSGNDIFNETGYVQHGLVSLPDSKRAGGVDRHAVGADGDGVLETVSCAPRRDGSRQRGRGATGKGEREKI